MLECIMLTFIPGVTARNWTIAWKPSKMLTPPLTYFHLDKGNRPTAFWSPDTFRTKMFLWKTALWFN